MTNIELIGSATLPYTGTEPAIHRRRAPLVTREQVIDVAYGLVLTHGPDGLSMRKLAVALHVSLPTVYTAIHSREFLVSQLQTRLFADIAGKLYAEDLSAINTSAPQHRLNAMVSAFFDWAQTNAHMADFLLSEQFSTEVAERLTHPDRNTPEAVAYLIGQCAELVDNGVLPAIDPVAGITFAVTQIRAVLALGREPAMAAVPTERWHALVTGTLLQGLKTLAG